MQNEEYSMKTAYSTWANNSECNALKKKVNITLDIYL